ncbi:MAG TPA: DMT family transporter [Anaerolineae bacterium]|nr:DMT family transporter [Anaerolineae bacterium]HRV95397.1 DMT family transporter [Anaerolineae bacterium]
MKLKTLLYLVTLALLWGVAFLFVKVAVRDIPPLTLVSARVALAAVILLAILRAQGRTLPQFGPIWKHFTVAGFLHNAAPYALLAWGQQYIDSALAAMFIGTVPLITMILAHIFTTDDHFTPTKIAGGMIGFGGLLVLLAPGLLAGVQVTTLGLLAALIAAICYGSAVVYGKITLQGLPPLVAPTAQLTTAAIFLVPVSLLVDRPYTLPMPSLMSLVSLLLLAVFSTSLVFYIFYRAMETTSATTLAVSTYLVPIIATLMGVFVLGERLAWNGYVGCALILLGVLTVNGLFARFTYRRPVKAERRPRTISVH